MATSLTKRECQRCGSLIPETSPSGECPVCLVELVLRQFGSSSSSAQAVATPVPAPRSPAPAEIQPHFPGLEVLEVLGRGGSGVVYKARQIEMDRLVALKLLAPERVADVIFAERLIREAQAMARLDHPHIVKAYDVGRAAGSVYVVMEYVDGESLRDRLRRGRLFPAEALRLIPRICDAVQYAHDHRVIHRDLKPENVLIDREGNVKIADFGLAKIRVADDDDDAEAFDDRLTESDARMGTAHYMAPEQWASTATVDHRADLYSLGVLFYEMLTGDLPTIQFRPPSAKADDVDPRFDKIIARALRDEPAQRYQTASAIKADVARIASAARWLSSRRGAARIKSQAMAAAAIGLSALGIALAIWAGVRWNQDRTQGPGPNEPRSNERANVGPGPGPDARKSETPSEILASRDWEWTPAENLGPTVNSEFDDGGPAISADGLTLLFHSDRPGGAGLTDIWQCQRASVDQPFGPAVRLPATINTPEHDGEPTLSVDGLTLVFVSHRQGGFGNADLWMAKRASVNDPWGQPVNLGPDINSEVSENRPGLAPDQLSLVFNSGRGEHPVQIVRRRSLDEPFGKPEPLDSEGGLDAANLVALSSDGLTAMFAIAPGAQLWQAQRPALGEPFANLSSLGPVINVPKGGGFSPTIAFDGRTIYFCSVRPGGQGSVDIWKSRRAPKPKSAASARK